MRLRHFPDESAGGHRQSPRCEAKLCISIRLSSPWLEAEANAYHQPEMMGETRNLSETGLAVSVPSPRIGGRYFNVAGCPLHLTLELPTGP
ncbi:MAG TPA: PilZ domain-containing protein, partial [Pyrinomonadaceae bacterium]|nr:PilZ domain-containing protein [Pyrinomonadaceae bacterium]